MVIHGALLCASHRQVVALLTCTEAMPPSLEKVSLVGASVAGGSEAVKLAAAELLLLNGSRVAAVTDATLLTKVPLLTPQLTVAMIVTVAEAPADIPTNVIERLLPRPLQTPPPSTAHDTNVTMLGRLSVNVMDWARSG